MNLQELNETYEEYKQTEDYYLEEGLKFFKKSNKLYKYADKILDKLVKAESKKNVSATEVSTLKALNKKVIKLADEFKVIEDNFSSGKMKKEVSKQKLKQLTQKKNNIIKDMKSDKTKSILKKVGLGAVAVATLVTLGALGMENAPVKVTGAAAGSWNQY